MTSEPSESATRIVRELGDLRLLIQEILDLIDSYGTDNICSETSESATTRMVTLRNGSEQPLLLVQITMMALRKMMRCTQAIKTLGALYQICLGTSPSKDDLAYLQRVGLLQHSGHIHPSVRSIVLSAVFCEGAQMELISPLAD